MEEGPKVLLIDIETLPAKAWVWEFWDTNVIELIEDWRILSFSAKWLDGEMYAYIDHKTDEFLVKKIWKLLDKADIVIAQNGDNFDIKKINTRFLYYNITPPSPYKTIDTLKISRSKFGHLSNKQDDVGKFLGIGKKLPTDKSLWLKCAAGDKQALKYMLTYNKRDVIMLEKIYKRYIPWIGNHPNYGIYKEKACCPKCGSEDVTFRGYYRGPSTKYHRFVCRKCGGWSRAPKNLNETQLMRNV